MKTISTEYGQHLSGTIGNVVGASWRGISYVRSLPKSKTCPDSQRRLAQQAKFQLAVGFVGAFKGLWQMSFESPERQSAFNAMVSYTIMNAITGTYPDLSIDFKKILISQGRLPGVDTASVTLDEPGKIVFHWENNEGTGSANKDDFAILGAYQPEMRSAIFSIGSATRAQQNSVLEATHFTGRKMHCYLGFVNSKRTTVANSVYTGEVLLLER